MTAPARPPKIPLNGRVLVGSLATVMGLIGGGGGAYTILRLVPPDNAAIYAGLPLAQQRQLDKLEGEIEELKEAWQSFAATGPAEVRESLRRIERLLEIHDRAERERHRHPPFDDNSGR